MPSLKSLEVEVAVALEHINVPSYMIDTAGIIRWTHRRPGGSWATS